MKIEQNNNITTLHFKSKISRTGTGNCVIVPKHILKILKLIQDSAVLVTVTNLGYQKKKITGRYKEKIESNQILPVEKRI